ncbi:unnamed protein product [Clonostachys chloroleuca]|uniref:Uncharacterized protein n=1 Tax=Clonostachys chloroleuca TaxID=1926264 RepID=A0AA35M6E9_9HYPO|nr:unnamed protein product [Clonostachys chloroleuca]
MVSGSILPVKYQEASNCNYTGVHILGQLHDGKIPDEKMDMVAIHRPGPDGAEKEKIKPNGGQREPAKKEDLEIQPPCDGNGDGRVSNIYDADWVEGRPQGYRGQALRLDGSQFTTHALGPYREDPAAKAKANQVKINYQAYMDDHKQRMRKELDEKKKKEKDEARERAKANREAQLKAQQAESS